MASDDVWAERLLREFEIIEEHLPQNVELIEHDMDPEAKGCIALFRCTIKQPVGIITNQTTSTKEFSKDTHDRLEFVFEFDFGIDTNYPFSPPTIRVIKGTELMPNTIYSQGFLNLQYVDEWTSEHTLLATISHLLITIQQALRNETETLILNTRVPINRICGACFLCCPITEPYGALNRLLVITKNELIVLGTIEDTFKDVLVLSIHEMTSIIQLNFRRNQSITLFFEDDIRLSFCMTESFACVYIIRDILKTHHGIEEKPLSSENLSHLTKATELMDIVKQNIARFERSPNIEIVDKIMNLARQATEQFAAANDGHYQNVLQAVHEFLKRPEVLEQLEKNANEQQTGSRISETLSLNNSKNSESETKFEKQDPQPEQNLLSTGQNTTNANEENDDGDNNDEEVFIFKMQDLKKN